MSQSKSRRNKSSKSSRSKGGALSKAAEKKSAKKKLKSDGIDFLSLLLGMTTTLLIGLLIYSRISGSPGASRALVAAETGEATTEVNSIDQSEFEELVENGSSVQLKNVLLGLRQSVTGGTIKERVAINMRRVDISNKMLTMRLSEDQRKLAIVSKLNSLTMNYGFGFSAPNVQIPSVVGNLKSCAQRYAEDPDTEISRTARLGLFNVEAYEMTKEDNKLDANYLAEEIGKLLIDFPNDQTVMANVGAVANRFLHKFDRQVAEKFSQKLHARKMEFESLEARRMIHDLVDESLLLKTKYYETFENRWVNADQSQRELHSKSIELANELDPGLKLIESIDLVAHWFEQDDQYDRSIEIYKEITNASDSYTDPEVAAEAKKKAADGIVRSELVTKKMDFAGCQFNGKTLPSSVVKDKIVVVLFWSAFNKRSTQLVSSVATVAAGWELQGVRVLAVNVDRKRVPETEPIITAVQDRVHLLFSNPKKNFDNHVLNQCPSDQVPRAMLIKKDGTVYDVNVPLSEIKTEVDFLINN